MFHRKGRLAIGCYVFAALGAFVVYQGLRGESRALAQDAGAPPALTPEVARQALIELQARAHEVAALPPPFGDRFTVQTGQEEGIPGNTWCCTLSRKHFIYIRGRPGHLYEVSGEFEYVRGRWQARVTGEAWECHGSSKE
jgi:hypothetical protein